MTLLKRTLLVLAITALAGSVNAQNKPAQNSGEAGASQPKAVLESYSHDFGTVTAGTPLTYSFKVKNEGASNLIIENVAPS